MPMRSQAQRAYLHIHHPQIAQRWEEHTAKGKKLPKRVASKRRKKRAGEELSIAEQLAIAAVDKRAMDRR